MNSKNKLEFKQKLLQKVKQTVQDQISAAQEMVKEAFEAVADDTKSTAGDKHETARAMAQIGQEKAGKQLIKIQTIQNLVQSISSDEVDKVSLGAVVYTADNCYFISQALGKISISGETIYCVSPTAPIVQAMLGLKKEESFTFNGRAHTLINIF